MESGRLETNEQRVQQRGRPPPRSRKKRKETKRNAAMDIRESGVVCVALASHLGFSALISPEFGSAGTSHDAANRKIAAALDFARAFIHCCGGGEHLVVHERVRRGCVGAGASPMLALPPLLRCTRLPLIELIRNWRFLVPRVNRRRFHSRSLASI